MLPYHVMNTNNPSQNNSKRQNQQSNLHTRAHGNANRKIHLIFAGHRYCGSVLRGITDDRKEDQSDESLADVARCG